MLALLGDSHTRSYVNSSYVSTRIFLAQGQKNNFASFSKFLSTTIRYLKAARRLKSAGLDIGFIIGEPDIRWIIYGKWHIGDPEEILGSGRELKIDKAAVDRVVARLERFLGVTKFFRLQPVVIIGCGSPNPEMVSACLYCNERFNTVCARKGYLFFNPQSYTVTNERGIKPEFVGNSVFDPSQKDHTHLSSEISNHFNLFIGEHMSELSSEDQDWKEQSHFYRYFEEVRNFDTYRPVDSLFARSVKFLNRLFSGLARRIGFGSRRSV